LGEVSSILVLYNGRAKGGGKNRPGLAPGQQEWVITFFGEHKEKKKKPLSKTQVTKASSAGAHG